MQIFFLSCSPKSSIAFILLLIYSLLLCLSILIKSISIHPTPFLIFPLSVISLPILNVALINFTKTLFLSFQFFKTFFFNFLSNFSPFPRPHNTILLLSFSILMSLNKLVSFTHIFEPNFSIFNHFIFHFFIYLSLIVIIFLTFPNSTLSNHSVFSTRFIFSAQNFSFHSYSLCSQKNSL